MQNTQYTIRIMAHSTLPAGRYTLCMTPFTNVKNVRQIRLFMQNKAKVKIGGIDKITPIHVFARAGTLTITVYDFTRGNLPPYKGGQNRPKLFEIKRIRKKWTFGQIRKQTMP